MSNRHDAQAIPVNSKERRLIQASVVADARVSHAPGVVLLEGQSVLASGAPESVGAPGPDVLVEDCRGSLICPPLVNAHVHLDLTDLAPRPSGADFDAWLGAIINHRRAQEAPGAIEAAVERGVQASLAGGCPFVGDISGSIRSFEALARSELAGVGYLELFGHGAREAQALSLLQEMIDRASGDSGPTEIKPGVSPHAPYSASQRVFEAAGASGLPVATHLAESLEEIRWCQAGDGPFFDRLAHMGYPADAVSIPEVHPLDLYPRLLPDEGALVAHANYAKAEHLGGLKRQGITVVYCPRAYRYFGHPKGDEPAHAWRRMREAGVPVALGTDGRPCLPAAGAAAARLSVLDEAACLQEQEGATIAEWLPMATVNGARGLGISEKAVLLDPGPKKALLVVPLEAGTLERIAVGAPIHDLLRPLKE